MELGRHGLQLGAVEHTHDGGLDDVVEVVPQRDLVAAQLFGLAVQVAAAHPGAQIAGVLVGAVGHGEDVAFKNRHRNVQKFCVTFDLLAVDLVVSGVHHQKYQLKRHIAVALQLLHELCHQHGVLAAGNAHGDAVALLHQLVALDRHDKGRPKLLAVFFDDAAFDQLIGFHFTFHSQFYLSGGQVSSR